MKAKVVLKPYGDNDQMLPGIYHIDGKLRVLLSETTFKDYTQYEYDKEKPKEISYTFSKKGMPTKEYEYETDEATQTPGDKAVENLMKIFWGQHPQVTVNGVSNPKYTKSPNYDLVNAIDKSVVSHKTWLKKLTAANRVYNMSYELKRDVAYFYGITPTNKLETDLTLILADFNLGVCLKEVSDGSTKSNLDIFLHTWLNESDEERSYIVNARKAITLGIFINNQAEGRTNYYYGQTFVGNTFTDVLAFCKRETRIYQENIVREIDLREGKEEKPKEKVAAAKEAPTAEATAKLEEVRSELRELVKDGFVSPVKGMHLMSIEKLSALVQEGKKKKEEKSVATA